MGYLLNDSFMTLLRGGIVKGTVEATHFSSASQEFRKEV